MAPQGSYSSDKEPCDFHITVKIAFLWATFWLLSWFPYLIIFDLRTWWKIVLYIRKVQLLLLFLITQKILSILRQFIRQENSNYAEVSHCGRTTRDNLKWRMHKRKQCAYCGYAKQTPLHLHNVLFQCITFQ